MDKQSAIAYTEWALDSVYKAHVKVENFRVELDHILQDLREAGNYLEDFKDELQTPKRRK